MLYFKELHIYFFQLIFKEFHVLGRSDIFLLFQKWSKISTADLPKIIQLDNESGTISPVCYSGSFITRSNRQNGWVRRVLGSETCDLENHNFPIAPNIKTTVGGRDARFTIIQCDDLSLSPDSAVCPWSWYPTSTSLHFPICNTFLTSLFKEHEIIQVKGLE